MTRQYLGDEYDRIVAAGVDGIAEFSELFSERYFPIWPLEPEDCEEDAYDILQHHFFQNIMIQTFGESLDSYHDVIDHQRRRPDLAAGQHLRGRRPKRKPSSLVNLWRETARDRNLLTAEIISQLPEKPWPTDLLRNALGGGRLEPILTSVLYHNQATGNPFLDFNDAEAGVEATCQWEQEDIEDVTEIWQEAQILFQGLERANQILQNDANQVFQQVINAVNQHMTQNPVDREAKP